MNGDALEDDLVEERSLREKEVGEDHVGEELWREKSTGQYAKFTETREKLQPHTSKPAEGWGGKEEVSPQLQLISFLRTTLDSPLSRTKSALLFPPIPLFTHSQTFSSSFLKMNFFSSSPLL